MFMHRGLFCFLEFLNQKIEFQCRYIAQLTCNPSFRQAKGESVGLVLTLCGLFLQSCFHGVFDWREVKQEPLGQIDAVPFIIIDAQKRVPL